MRDRDTIDSELRHIAELRRSMRDHGGELSSRQIDELLDERLGHLPEPSPKLAARGALPRLFRLPAVLPLSLLAVGAVLAVMFMVHNRQHPASPATVVPPSSAPSNPAMPKAPAPADIIERAFIEALKQEGVPVPSREYVTSHGHAVCDFLAHQPKFDEAVSLVQRTSIWDANQSADFAAGAIVSYCPQYKPVTQDQIQQPSEGALTDLERINGDLQRIEDDLSGIRNGLPWG